MNLVFFLSKILKKSKLSSLLDCRIHESSKVESGCSLTRTTFDRHSFCGYDCTMMDTNVGSFTSIGSRVTIGGVSHPMHFVSMSPAFLSHRDSIRKKYARHHYLPRIVTNIGSDVWIADGAYIKAGVNIGHGAVIGMGAVVTHDVESYTVVAGNPAKSIRKRFANDICSRLLESKWWELPDIELNHLGNEMNNPIEFLAALERRGSK